MKLPELTIVMPFYNKKEQVAGMIDCIRANDYVDWELLAVDDGSDADTRNALAHYASEDSRVIFLERGQRLPKGAQTCRNLGMEKARGTFVVFFDSDDYVTPTCLGTRVREIKTHPDFDFMVFPSGVMQGEAFVTKPGRHTYGYPVFRDDVAHFACRDLPFIVWNNIYRLSTLRNHMLEWDTKLTALQDADFNLQAILAGLRYGYAQTPPDYGYRVEGAGSVSSEIAKPKSFGNSIYATWKFYDVLQRHFGHKYDKEIYLGAVTLINGASYNRLERKYVQDMAEVMSSFASSLAQRLIKRLRLLDVTEKILSSRRARQVTLLPEILTILWGVTCKVIRMRRIARKRIKK